MLSVGPLPDHLVPRVHVQLGGLRHVSQLLQGCEQQLQWRMIILGMLAAQAHDVLQYSACRLKPFDVSKNSKQNISVAMSLPTEGRETQKSHTAQILALPENPLCRSCDNEDSFSTRMV